MKLSKVQQEVVDKMREGWELKHYRIEDVATITNSKLQIADLVQLRTVSSLIKKRVIMEEGILYTEYRLTEQYKPKQND